MIWELRHSLDQYWWRSTRTIRRAQTNTDDVLHSYTYIVTEYLIPGTGSWDLAQLESTRLTDSTTSIQPTDIKVDILQYFIHSLQFGWGLRLSLLNTKNQIAVQCVSNGSRRVQQCRHRQAKDLCLPGWPVWTLRDRRPASPRWGNRLSEI